MESTTFKTELDIVLTSSADTYSSLDNVLTDTRTTTDLLLDNSVRERALTPSDVRLPGTCNIVALRETLLSEAPFITRSNKPLWRKFLETQHYVTMVSCAYKHLASAISEIGHFNVDTLYEVNKTPMMRLMAGNMSNIIFEFPRTDRDIFFAKLPEILTYMVISALHSSMPKHHRLYNSIRFRSIVIDWACELVTGIRPVNTRANKDWLYADATDSHITVHDKLSGEALEKSIGRRNRLRQEAMSDPSYKGKPILEISSAKTSYYLDKSPLVSTYISMHRDDYVPGETTNVNVFDKNALTITLSHSPHRPLLTSLQTSNITGHGRCRERKTDNNFERKEMRKSLRHRKKIMNDLKVNTTNFNKEIEVMREQLNTTILILKKDYKVKRLEIINNSSV